MPVVLVLFCIALVVTFLGLFLTPRSQARPARDEYTVIPREKRMVGTSPKVGRARERWVDEVETGTGVIPLKVRANRTQERAQIPRPQAARPRVTKSASIALKGGLWGGMGSWKAVVPGLVAVVVLGFYLLNMSLPRPLLWVPAFFGASSAQATSASPTPTLQPLYGASQHLTRLNQLDSAQYRSMQEYNIWAYSACSAAAMTEVINAYGHKYRVTDILALESKINAITPELGLLSEAGIERTGTQFGFKTSWGHNLNLDQVIAAANRGTPVIVSFPPPIYPGGHIVVVRGGNANSVYLADSSRLNWTQLTRAGFLHYWRGFSAIMTPN
ncbi:MAG TPA: C39 family peptidase [Ktedonobacteraceae bacterium]